MLDNNNKYQTGPSISPEQGPMMLGVKYDMQLVYELFTNFLEAAELMGATDTELINDIEYKRANMDMPWEIGESQDGQLMEWDIDIDGDPSIWYNPDDPHRHISHLMALYPTAQINRNTPELMNAAKRTLNLRKDKATGWSRAFKTVLWARAIGDDGSGTGTRSADRAYKIFQGQLTDNVYDNLFDAHEPFQADGNYGATAALCEFMMQSGTGDIDILPALPTAWQEKSAVKGLVARGGFELNLAWENGRATQIDILSKAGGECILSYPYFAADTKVLCDGKPVETERNGNKLIFDTVKGKSYSVEFGTGYVYNYEISDIIYDNGGDTPVPVDNISAGGSIKEVIITKHIESDENKGMLITELYDENGVLRGIKTVDADMSDYLLNTSQAVKVGLDIPGEANENWHTKAFLFDSMANITPLSVSYTKK